MRINSDRSIETGEKLHARFGSWKAVREAAIFRGGKFVVAGRADRERVPPPTVAAE